MSSPRSTKPTSSITPVIQPIPAQAGQHLKNLGDEEEWAADLKLNTERRNVTCSAALSGSQLDTPRVDQDCGDFSLSSARSTTSSTVSTLYRHSSLEKISISEGPLASSSHRADTAFDVKASTPAKAVVVKTLAATLAAIDITEQKSTDSSWGTWIQHNVFSFFAPFPNSSVMGKIKNAGVWLIQTGVATWLTGKAYDSMLAQLESVEENQSDELDAANQAIIVIGSLFVFWMYHHGFGLGVREHKHLKRWFMNSVDAIYSIIDWGQVVDNRLHALEARLDAQESESRLRRKALKAICDEMGLTDDQHRKIDTIFLQFKELDNPRSSRKNAFAARSSGFVS
jgi:hypothetical protein